MRTWDPHGLQHLRSIRRELDRIGLVGLAHEAIVEVWRSNSARYEPEELFDDAFTLGVNSTRNLANRLYAYARGDERWRATGVQASQEFGATVLHTGGLDLRLVKAPSTAGRKPDFVADFDWQSGEMRHAAAARNRAAYGLPARRPSEPALFEVELPDAATAVRACRDLFLVWGADLTTGLTAGWLGLPTTTADRWIALARLWWDEAATSQRTDGASQTPAGDTPGFEDQPAPVPTITLKPRRQEAGAP
ncbi:hypothetical protein [Jiangella endophytica]|uniref:hypothetical protein n=1 Tax=Jiangella endophytica TaxID=1623398 RepID=UPI000E340D43|nr:hypothetical protein [Jiangella endophytica]